MLKYYVIGKIYKLQFVEFRRGKITVLSLIQGIGVIAIYTWFLWPFIFVFTLIHAFRNILKDESPTLNIIISSVSLLMIICALMTAAL